MGSLYGSAAPTAAYPDCTCPFHTHHPTAPQERLMEHLKLFSTRLNVPQLIRVCEELELWKELTFL